MNIFRLLIRHEGLRLKAYKCTEGKTTIGVGRNLDDVGITKAEAIMLLENDIKRVDREALQQFPWYKNLDYVRKDVIISMIFNMGLHGFMQFKKAISAMAFKNYDLASKEMLDSKWAKQVEGRAHELSQMMLTGKYLNEKEGDSKCLTKQ